MQLDDRVKELIAIGASVTANCLGCVEFHVAKARQLGVEEPEITEAIRVGKLVRRGAANKFDKFAHDLSKEAPSPADTSAQSCSCESPG